MSLINVYRYDVKHDRMKFVQQTLDEIIAKIAVKVEVIEPVVITLSEQNTEQNIKIEHLYEDFIQLQGMVNYTCPVKHD